MSKRYLGIICLIYSTIFGYVVIFDKLKNFLAPSMQIYIILSIIPLLFIGLVMLFNNRVNYKFKCNDLILLLPLILLILTGDGRLTTSFASNRTTNFNTENKTKIEEKEVIKQEEPKKEEKIEEPGITDDFSKVDINIIDANYSELANYITFAPKADKYNGNTIKFRGFAIDKLDYLPDGYYAIGKYMITCCAADADFAGFIIKTNETIITSNWYEIEGVLEKGKDKEGNDIMVVNAINIKEIDSKKEEQYVYPCYAYDGGLCEALKDYNLEY